jgi:hypothetical protein
MREDEEMSERKEKNKYIEIIEALEDLGHEVREIKQNIDYSTERDWGGLCIIINPFFSKKKD